jgi:essential nuclear protein 1
MASMGFSPKVIKVFTDVAAFLSRYKSGKLPKVMKILPTMAGWDELLGLTAPDSWTPHAFYAVTRIFVSNLNDVRAQRFLNLYLLPAVRNDIQTSSKLNYHLYQALRKALYKPAAWYRGVLLPLARSGDCTLREATIVSSVLTTKRVPQLQSAAAIYVLATMPYSPAVSVFLRVMLSKRYTLTLRVIEALVAHFTGFVRVPGPLPVLWHQAFLVFAQRYGPSTTQAQRDALKPVLAAHVHRAITAEVHTALFAASPKRLAAAAGNSASSSSAYGQAAVSAPGPVKGAGSASSLGGPRGGVLPAVAADEDEDM